MFTKKPEKNSGDASVQNPTPTSTGLSQAKTATPAPVNPAPATMTPKPIAMTPGKSVPSIFAGDISITGNIQSQGEIQIDGRVEGDI
jgi:hypothetical protein